MKKKNIVKNNRDFQRIIHNYKPYKYKDYIIYLERIEEGEYHFGISVSKKLGNAVVRNRIKRQMRSIIQEKDYQKNFNCIIILGKGILNRDYHEMKENLLEALKRLDVYR